jgi:hypothetical protein
VTTALPREADDLAFIGQRPILAHIERSSAHVAGVRSGNRRPRNLYSFDLITVFGGNPH